jgi:hypothetical protein
MSSIKEFIINFFLNQTCASIFSELQQFNVSDPRFCLSDISERDQLHRKTEIPNSKTASFHFSVIKTIRERPASIKNYLLKIEIEIEYLKKAK